MNNAITYYDASGKKCNCVYDGTAADFKRLEYGLPPLKCTHQVDITNRLDTAMRENSQSVIKIRDEVGYFEAVGYFTGMVRGGGLWDFKSQEEWGLSSEKTYYYHGIPLRYDDIGNIHYGYVGKELYTTSVLLKMGGVIQIISGTSEWKYFSSNFDDPRDQMTIKYGCILWDRDHENENH